jgi:hypothetical protein
MLIHIKTESDSIYTIDDETLRWTRSSDHEILGVPGLESEQLMRMPDITPGQRILLLSPSGTWVSTSRVKTFWFEGEDGA